MRMRGSGLYCLWYRYKVWVTGEALVAANGLAWKLGTGLELLDLQLPHQQTQNDVRKPDKYHRINS